MSRKLGLWSSGMVGNKTERDELKTEGAATVDAILVKE